MASADLHNLVFERDYRIIPAIGQERPDTACAWQERHILV
jgi:hypothetical protein